MLLWDPIKGTEYPGFTKKLDDLGWNPDYFGVPYYHFDVSKKWTSDELKSILTWDAGFLIAPGFHAVENIFDVVEALPEKEAFFYKSLIRQMEQALFNHDGEAFYKAADRWPGLYG